MKKNQNRDFVSASNLLHPVELYTITETTDGQGGFEVTDEVLKTVYADFEIKEYNKLLEEEQITYTHAINFFVRFDIDINYAKYLLFDGVKYIIHSVVNIGNRNEFFKIIAYSNG
jgi:SPP1 family predicted phage head-tail adaptor